MKTLKYYMVVAGHDVEVAFPMVAERILIHEILVANDVAMWVPVTEWAMMDLCKQVRMSAHEIAWFVRL
jgi:hypothetical protein